MVMLVSLHTSLTDGADMWPIMIGIVFMLIIAFLLLENVELDNITTIH